MLKIEGWARQGLTDIQIAQNIGIGERTFTEWKSRFSAISAALKKGKAPVDFEVENALLKRAKGFEYEESVTETIDLGNGKKRVHTKVMKKYMPPDTGAAFIWLKNRMPSVWRDKPEPPVSSEALERLDEVLSNIKGVI